MEKETIENNIEFPEKAYELLYWASKGQDITVRDDQYDFPWLLDSVRLCRKQGFRFRLLDSGKLDRFQLEWLAKAGADFYSSDDVRANTQELEFLNKASQGGGALIAYFYHGFLESLNSEEESRSVSFSDLMNLGRNGIYIHLSSRGRKVDFSLLNHLAYVCRKGGSWLVYYHHGPIVPSLEELGGNGAWIHLSHQSIQEVGGNTLLLDTVKSARSAGTNLVLHLERELDFLFLRDVFQAGAYVLFRSLLVDYRSPLRSLEKEARKRSLDFRAYYLYPIFLS